MTSSSELLIVLAAIDSAVLCLILEHTLNIGSDSSFWEVSLAISPELMSFDFGLIPNHPSVSGGRRSPVSADRALYQVAALPIMRDAHRLQTSAYLPGSRP